MNTALRLFVPEGNVEVWVCAVPALTVTGLPMSLPLSSNWTVPGAADGDTVAVRVSCAPVGCGLGGDTDSAVVVLTALTVNEAVPVDAEKPLPVVGVKTAVRLSAPTGSVDVCFVPSLR